jgi:hypothetical protein
LITGGKRMSNEAPKEAQKEKKQSFWSTLPGIVTAITGLVIAITGLVTALGENGILNRSQATPTPFLTATSVDSDVTLPAPVQTTPEPTQAVLTPPTCRNYSEYKGKANPNAILLAFTDQEFWVRYAEIEDDVENLSGLEAFIFDTSDGSGECLRRWVKYLVVDHTANWPASTTDKGRTYNEVWMNSPTPPIVGELANWEALPETLLITVVDSNSNPQYVQIFMCGQDVPREVRSQVAYWHAATSEDAFQGYLDQYESNGFDVRITVSCGG